MQCSSEDQWILSSSMLIIYSKTLAPVVERLFCRYSVLKILRISPYSVQMRENTGQKHFEYWHFSRSDFLQSIYRKSILFEFATFSFAIAADRNALDDRPLNVKFIRELKTLLSSYMAISCIFRKLLWKVGSTAFI